MRSRGLAGQPYLSTLPCAGRLLAGFGAGAASVYVPRYLIEIAPDAIRGALGTCTQVGGWRPACPMFLAHAGPFFKRAEGWRDHHSDFAAGCAIPPPMQRQCPCFPPCLCMLHWLGPGRCTGVAPELGPHVLCALVQVCINIGILAAYAMGFPYEDGDARVQLLGRDLPWWRLMFAVALAPCLLQARSWPPPPFVCLGRLTC